MIVDRTVVDINLSGSDSYWTGNTLVSWGSGKPADETKLEVNDAHVTLSDGAQWNPTVVEADESRFEEIMERVVKACKRVEPDCRILR